MNKIGRRNFLSASAMALPTSILLAGRYDASAIASPLFGEAQQELVEAQVQREKVWAFIRSYYHAKGTGDVAGFLSHFYNSAKIVYQDATLGATMTGYPTIASAFQGFITNVNAILGDGRFSKPFHVTGDLRYGAIAEYVDLPNTFYGTNGITIQTVFDFDGGRIARDTDYWDSRELGLTDFVGPAVTSGVAAPLGAVHAGGVPRTAAPPVPPGIVSLATGVTGKPSASPELVELVNEFHNALSHGSAAEISGFFTDDATYVTPLLHQGPPLYPNFDQTLQVNGRGLIARLLLATLEWLPDCRNSKLIHIVGGPAGGGFEWQAGGIYGRTGLDRTGLHGYGARFVRQSDTANVRKI